MIYFEDLDVGVTTVTGTYDVSSEEIIDFARQFDPQPFHTDPEAAAGTLFGELVASGWQTAAITMRLMLDRQFLGATPMIGLGVEALRWPRPVRPGDRLTAHVEILEIRPSRSDPARGSVRARTTTVNQAGDTVYDMTSPLLVPRRPAE